MMKIFLFFKPSMVKVCFSLVLFIYLIIEPSYALAFSLSDWVTKVFGAETPETQISMPADDQVHNSQNLPLLESSINPDAKSVEDTAPVAIVEDEALLNNGPLGTDSELEKYASSEKIDVYIVKKGDTLESISKKFKVPMNTIIESNTDLKKSDLLKIGQKLAILPVKDHQDQIAQASDTGSAAQTTKPTEKKTETKPTQEEEKPAVVKKEQPKEEDTGPLFTINTDLLPSPQAPSPTPQTASPSVNLPSAQVQVGATIDTKPEESGQPEGTINGGYIWPFEAGIGRVSQGLHADQAYDFAAPKGTPIHAVQSGTVLIAKASGYNGGYGLYVVIKFDDGRQAIFGHMSKVAVSSGDTVKQGDIIGYVGSTGKSTGPHVHIGFHGSMGNPYAGLKVNSTSIDSND